MALTEKNKRKLERQYGREALQAFSKEVGLYGGNYEAFTNSEARQLLEAGSLDEARNRIFEARQERNGEVRQSVFQGTQTESDNEINTEGRPERGGPVHGRRDTDALTTTTFQRDDRQRYFGGVDTGRSRANEI
ncbi:hypothetical protein FACS1894187_23400 [Synergistales bacterium]|nr:hypothetical protein FACS1894187_23400 [Synergistales bacterium]